MEAVEYVDDGGRYRDHTPHCGARSHAGIHNGAGAMGYSTLWRSRYSCGYLGRSLLSLQSEILNQILGCKGWVGCCGPGLWWGSHLVFTFLISTYKTCSEIFRVCAQVMELFINRKHTHVPHVLHEFSDLAQATDDVNGEPAVPSRLIKGVLQFQDHLQSVEVDCILKPHPLSPGNGRI